MLSPVISNPKRFMVGGLGSLLPMLYTLAVGKDLDYFIHPTLDLLLGWFLRTSALFVLGGLTAVFLKNKLRTASAIFLAGIVAPGIVRGVISQDGAAVYFPSQTTTGAEKPGTEPGISPPEARATAPKLDERPPAKPKPEPAPKMEPLPAPGNPVTLGKPHPTPTGTGAGKPTILKPTLLELSTQPTGTGSPPTRISRFMVALRG